MSKIIIFDSAYNLLAGFELNKKLCDSYIKLIVKGMLELILFLYVKNVKFGSCKKVFLYVKGFQKIYNEVEVIINLYSLNFMEASYGHLLKLLLQYLVLGFMDKAITYFKCQFYFYLTTIIIIT